MITIFVSLDMLSDFKMSSRTRSVAVAVNAMSGISNFKNSEVQALKFSRNTDSRLIYVRGT